MRDRAKKLPVAIQTYKPSCHQLALAAELFALHLLDKQLYNQELHLLQFHHTLKCLSSAFQVL